jgi:prepilin-type N-terminal cleavage/methylation domain-containing protein
MRGDISRCRASTPPEERSSASPRVSLHRGAGEAPRGWWLLFASGEGRVSAPWVGFWSRIANAFRQPAGRLERRAGGFTLVELLTVIAIIAVLATLLMTSLGTAKKKSRQTVCIGNLRQISLALNMYLDDFAKRPSGFESLVSDKYLTSLASFLCPEDKTRPRNWGGLVHAGAPPSQESSGPAPSVATNPSPEVLYSYLHPLFYDDSAWNTLAEQGSSAGIACLPIARFGKQDLELPSIYNFLRLVLRAQRDTAVVRRQVYWDQPASSENRAAPFVSPPTMDAAISASVSSPVSLAFFTDQPPVSDPSSVTQP